MTLRVRGIYATALTDLFGSSESGDATNSDDSPAVTLEVVQASSAIDDRFPDRDFPIEPADATLKTTDDRQGIGLIGDQATVADALGRLTDVGIDVLAWRDPLSKGALFDGEVRETMGGGAVVALGDGAGDQSELQAGLERCPLAAGDHTGFLPYRNTDGRLEEGDVVRVQVRDPAQPWADDRAVLDTTIRVNRRLLALQRGGVAGTGGPHLGDILPIDPPDGWGVRWANVSEDASLDALGAALEGASERATRVDDAIADADTHTDADAPADREPTRLALGQATAWIWFGRESRFALDDLRRGVTATMPGHHRTKAGANAASAAVDFVESLCPNLDENSPSSEDVDFPFDTVTDHFGPTEGDTVAIHHGKPEGRRITLGRADVASIDADGTVELRRELTSSGTYDGLGTPRERGDVATTKIVEGRWWYPTVYRSVDGDHRGTYVNVCTPVEVFPDAVRYVDLHVDVVKRPDGTVERLDDDELDAAATTGYLSDALAEKARTVASAVERAL